MNNQEYFDNNWTYTHFLIYLYTCIAASDYNISEEEIEQLHLKLDNIFLPEQEVERMFHEVLSVYKNQNDIEVIEFINHYAKKYLQTTNEKQKILADLQEMIKADGIVEPGEKIMFLTIKKIFENPLEE
jgi:nicotinamide mononucleotide adenylyltransferase